MHRVPRSGGVRSLARHGLAAAMPVEAPAPVTRRALVLAVPAPAPAVLEGPPSRTLNRPPRTSSALRALRSLGLSASEAVLYLGLQSPVAVPAQSARLDSSLHRATIYRVLLRLLDRGLVTGDGGRPQRYRAVPVAVLFRRMHGFLLEEAELRLWLSRRMDEEFGSAPPPRPMNDGPSPRLELTSWAKDSPYNVLTQLGQARRSLRALLRPAALPASQRGALLRTLQALAGSGVRLQLLLEGSPADHRFLATLRSDPALDPAAVEVRHLTPQFGQLFLVDSAAAVRLSVYCLGRRLGEPGILMAEEILLRQQVARFEALWSEGVPRGGRAPLPTGSGFGLPAVGDRRYS